MVGDALRARFKASGFHTGNGEKAPCVINVPVNLNLVGTVEVSYDPDGTWTFEQELHADLSDRMAFADESHRAAVDNRGDRTCR